MVDEVIERFVPGGVFIVIGVAVGAAFGERLRPVAKEALKQGMTLAERGQEAAAEAFEKAQDLIAEARYEQEQEVRAGTRNSSRNGTARKSSPAKPRPSRTHRPAVRIATEE